MRRLIDAFKTHPMLTPAFLLAAALTLMFTIRTIVFTLYWADPAHRDQPIEPWMTPRYVAHSWDLPAEQVAAALGLEPGSARRLSLAEIATSSGLSMDEIAQRIRAAAAAHRGQGQSR